jgi:Tfp pilus assembly PilM family ATPase
MRRAVPFRLSEAALSYQILDGETSGGVTLLVALARQSLVEQYEQALAGAGSRPGLIDLCTLNLLNLCRPQIEAAAREGGDVALLNCTGSYFSLIIVRKSRLIFFRCKSYSVGDDQPGAVDGLLAREVSSSFSYYEEKLAGQGIAAVLVRSAAQPFDEVASSLAGLGLPRVEPVDPGALLGLVNGQRLDPETAQRIAPAVGAAAGRS